MYQALTIESKYSVYNNQQLAMGIGMLLNRLRQRRSKEAWIYIRAIVMAEMEDPLPELNVNQPLVNQLRKPNDKNKKSGAKAAKDGSGITSKEKP